MTTLERRERHGLLAVNLGLLANAALAALKTAVGILGHSPALLAEGINSTADVAYYAVVSIFMRLARKPADADHPYGHRQLESIAAVVVGAFVVTTAIAVFWDAVNNVFDLWVGESQFEGAHVSALWVALLTVVVKAGLSIWTSRLGRRAESPTVLALAADHRNDVLSASAAAVGIFLGRAGNPWVDPLVGALVALVILRTGISILRDSAAELMGTVPGPLLAELITAVARSVPGVWRVEEIQAQRFGPFLIVNLTLGIDGELTVTQGDQVASAVEQALCGSIELLRRVHVHYHPAPPAEQAAAIYVRERSDIPQVGP